MTQTVDPVTQHHIDRAAERLAESSPESSRRRRSRGTWRSPRICSGRPASTSSSRFSPTASPASDYRRSPRRKERSRRSNRKSCSSASTTPAEAQMAAGLVKLRSEGRIHVRSAGSAPADEVNPAVVQAMTEIGVDMSEEFPKPLTDEVVRAADVVITMGCGDACPIYPGKRYEDWELEDPADQDVDDCPPHPGRRRRAGAAPRRRADRLDRLREHPAMALEVLDAVMANAEVGDVLGLRED